MASFAFVAVTGILLLLEGHAHARWHGYAESTPIPRETLLSIHEVAGIVFIVLVLIHLAINWTCLTSMTKVAAKR